MKKSTITPFHDQVLLQEVPKKGISDGGIIIPSAHMGVTNQGIVVDKGPLCTDQIQLEDIVFFPLHSEARTEYKGNKFILVPESSILGAIREVNIADIKKV